MHLEISRFDGGVRIYPAPPYILDFLQYYKRGMITKGYKREFQFISQLLYALDGEGGCITLSGFYDKIIGIIKEYGEDTYEVIDQRTSLPDINWKRVKEVGLRDYQVDPIVEFLTKAQITNGICKAAPGYGKTAIQAATYAAWNGLNTILAIPLKEVVLQTAKHFQTWFPEKEVGVVGAGMHSISSDITICTYASMKLCALEKCELLLMDEIQSATGDKIQEILRDVQPHRILGYTATDDKLFNNGDKLLTGIFGERLIDIGYRESEEVDAVVPCVVYFLKTNAEPVAYKSFESKFKYGVKECEPRNKLIGEILSKVPKGWQTITFVDHVTDHLINVYRHMPSDSKYLHRESSKKRVGTYALSTKQQDKIIAEFKNNGFQHLLATDAFRAGVSVNNVRVVVQGAGGTSKVELIQEAGRGSRTLSVEEQERLGVEPKTHFVLIDFWDEHDEALNSMAIKRMKTYQAEGWQVNLIDVPEDIDWRAF